MKSSRFVQGCCAAVVALAVNMGAANGAQRFWSGSASNDWFVPSNWQSFNVPTATDDVLLPSTLAGFPVPRTDVELTSSTTVNAMRVDILLYSAQQSLGYSLYGESGDTLTVTNGLSVESVSNIPGRFRVNGVGIQSASGFLGTGGELTLGDGAEWIASGTLNVGIIAKVVVNSETLSAGTLDLADESSTTINSGGTVSAGVLKAARNSNSGWGKPSITINSGGTLELGFSESHKITDGVLTLNPNGDIVMPSATLTLTGADADTVFNTNYNVRSGSVLALRDGADATSTSYLDVGYQNVGTLVVEDAGSSVTATGSTNSDWGFGSGAQAFVIFQTG